MPGKASWIALPRRCVRLLTRHTRWRAHISSDAQKLNRLNVSLFTPSLLFSKVAFFLTPGAYASSCALQRGTDSLECLA